MLEWYMTPGFVYKPESPLYGRQRGEIPLPYYVIDAGQLRKYRAPETHEVVLDSVRHQCAQGLRAAPDVESVTVYDDMGNVLHVWTRKDLGL